MSDTKVGILIPEGAVRDAIHIAVAPAIASGSFLPGEHVGLMADGRVGTRVEKHVGIIDPFLEHPVREGERCWIFLYPQTVTGMRHHWSHPAFNDVSTPQEVTLSEKEESEKWLREYAVRMNSYDGTEESAYLRLIDGLKHGEIHAYGSDLHSLDGLYKASDLRKHAERVLGIRIEWENFTFTCSC